MAALESLLVERGLITSDVVDAVVETYERDVGPLNGARVVARAWVDPTTTGRACWPTARGRSASWASAGPRVSTWWCSRTRPRSTTSSCARCARATRGRCWACRRVWYKSFAYRARAVREPRAVMAEFGTVVPDDVEVRVWDSSAEVRYLVLPQRPPGTDGLDEDALAALVTRDHMIGVVR